MPNLFLLFTFSFILSSFLSFPTFSLTSFISSPIFSLFISPPSLSFPGHFSFSHTFYFLAFSFSSFISSLTLVYCLHFFTHSISLHFAPFTLIFPGFFSFSRSLSLPFSLSFPSYLPFSCFLHNSLVILVFFLSYFAFCSSASPSLSLLSHSPSLFFLALSFP